MGEIFRRRVHIEGTNTSGHSVVVRDIETGEIIPGIFHVVATMEVSKVNVAEITYYETKEGRIVVGKDGKPIIHTATVEAPKIDVKALERLPWMKNRDTQFQGFAWQLFDEVATMFNNRFIELDNCEESQAEKTKQDIIDCFAERAYDLVEHALFRSGLMQLDWRVRTESVFNTIPDMTTWPEREDASEPAH